MSEDIEAPPVLHCPRISEIRDAVCRRYGLTEMEMLSAQRARYVSRPRQIAMYLARKMTVRSLPEIGRHFGNRDHTTVMHASRNVEKLCEDDLEIAADVALLRFAIAVSARARERNEAEALAA